MQKAETASYSTKASASQQGAVREKGEDPVDCVYTDQAPSGN